ncbi:hypothetical protein B0H13DRAFT_636908 [Mycena leptocephala]|nr:hypothetical protein B0H13DRAFT_636908 [Mycena leptocephala]
MSRRQRPRGRSWRGRTRCRHLVHRFVRLLQPPRCSAHPHPPLARSTTCGRARAGGRCCSPSFPALADPHHPHPYQPARDPAVDEGRRSSARRRAVLAHSTSRTLAVPPFVCVAPRTHQFSSVSIYERRRKSPPPARSRSQCAGRARARLVPVMEGGPILLKPPLPARAPQSTRRRAGRARGVRVASSLLPHSFVHPPVPILICEQLPKVVRSSNRPSPLAAPRLTTATRGSSAAALGV